MTDHLNAAELNRRREDARITLLFATLEKRQKQIVRLISIALLGLISTAGLLIQLYHVIAAAFVR